MSRFWFTRRDQGLREGQPVSWFLGGGEDAPSFEVHVQELRYPDTIAISWERDGAFTQVRWTLEEPVPDETILTIEESGFAGGPEAVVAQAIDSTGGFNQVVVAAKALIEHGISLNVVADHA